MVKNSPANAGDIKDPGSIPGLGRSLGGGHGNPLQYSCLENPHGQRSHLTCPHGFLILNIFASHIPQLECHFRLWVQLHQFFSLGKLVKLSAIPFVGTTLADCSQTSFLNRLTFKQGCPAVKSRTMVSVSIRTPPSSLPSDTPCVNSPLSKVIIDLVCEYPNVLESALCGETRGGGGTSLYWSFDSTFPRSSFSSLSICPTSLHTSFHGTLFLVPTAILH